MYRRHARSRGYAAGADHTLLLEGRSVNRPWSLRLIIVPHIDLCHVPFLYCTAEYEELVTAGRAAVLRSLAAAGVGVTADSILRETVTTPPQWQQQFGLEHGAAFGLSHGLNQLAVFRPSIKDQEVKGLYFVGASTRPGNGVPLCMISAALAEERISSDFPVIG